MPIQPLHDRIVVRRVEEKRQSAGGIIIPDNAAEKPNYGVVVAIGSGKALDNGQIRALTVKVGDEVLFGKYSGTEIELHGEKLIVMREDDIMATVKK
ncbi:MAG: co-chaperone GroES [Legionellaceae bacterium]|nr:co-chaperone GroES [Legionellaceae bacterium]